MRSVSIGLMLCLSASLLPSYWASPAKADEGSCCQGCGCQSCCKKVCRLVCETKKIKEPYYCCECEDFCLPGPSKCCGYREVCEPCGKTHLEKIWQPSCGHVKTRYHLVKKEVEKEVCVYKCEVVYLCNRCCQHCKTCQGGAAMQPSQTDSALTPDLQVAQEPEPAADVETRQSFVSRLIGR